MSSRNATTLRFRCRYEVSCGVVRRLTLSWPVGFGSCCHWATRQTNALLRLPTLAFGLRKRQHQRYALLSQRKCLLGPMTALTYPPRLRSRTTPSHKANLSVSAKARFFASWPTALRIGKSPSAFSCRATRLKATSSASIENWRCPRAPWQYVQGAREE